MIDNSGYLLSNKAFLIDCNDRSVLCALNSPIGWWVSWRHFVHMKDEALSNDGTRIIEFPISTIISNYSESLSSASENLEEENNIIRQSNTGIQDWLRHEFGLDKVNRVLAAPQTLDADAFIAAVRAALPKSRKLSATEIARLKQEYAETVVPAREAAGRILVLERELSDIVNAAYGLTPEEVRLMWQTAPPRMPLDPEAELRRLISDA